MGVGGMFFIKYKEIVWFFFIGFFNLKCGRIGKKRFILKNLCGKYFERCYGRGLEKVF